MSRRVLVVDNEEAIVSGLMCLLEAEAINSAGAFDRRSAESLMETTFYAVIVADIRLHTNYSRITRAVLASLCDRILHGIGFVLQDRRDSSSFVLAQVLEWPGSRHLSLCVLP
jgi:CheY-like chemotaxis protein